MLVLNKEALDFFGLKLFNCLIQSVLYLTKLVNKDKVEARSKTPEDRAKRLEKRQLLVIIRKVFLSLTELVDYMET